MEFGKIDTRQILCILYIFPRILYNKLLYPVHNINAPHMYVEDKRSLSINFYSFNNKRKIAYFIYIEMRYTVHLYFPNS